MFINYNAKNVYTYRKKLFIPGLNEISKELWEEMKTHPVFKVKISSGVIVPQDETEDLDIDEGLKGFGLKESKDMVRNTFDMKLLEKWKELETRKSVLKVIEEQIDDLIVDPEEESDS